MILYLCAVLQLLTPLDPAFGLMDRRSLPDDQGMLFTMPVPQKASFWMFNCYIDLSIAFVNSQMQITEIHEMKAFPYLMDPMRPVHSIEDLALYPADDPICQFFHDHSIRSKDKVCFAIEANNGWFETHEVKVGDRIELKDGVVIFD